MRNCASYLIRSPYGVAFDGSDIWVSNNGSNPATELRASAGATLGTFNTGRYPCGLAFDGVNVWIANSGDGTISKL